MTSFPTRAIVQMKTPTSTTPSACVWTRVRGGGEDKGKACESLYAHAVCVCVHATMHAHCIVLHDCIVLHARTLNCTLN